MKGETMAADTGGDCLYLSVSTHAPLCLCRIQVNDLIVEVDGTSLVGVTQSLAASVLRNTSGTVRSETLSVAKLLHKLHNFLGFVWFELVLRFVAREFYSLILHFCFFLLLFF